MARFTSALRRVKDELTQHLDESGQSHLNWPACEDFEEVVVVPAAAEAFAGDPDLLGGLGLEEIDRSAVADRSRQKFSAA